MAVRWLSLFRDPRCLGIVRRRPADEEPRLARRRRGPHCILPVVCRFARIRPRRRLRARLRRQPPASWHAGPAVSAIDGDPCVMSIGPDEGPARLSFARPAPLPPKLLPPFEALADVALEAALGRRVEPLRPERIRPIVLAR